MLTNDDLAQLQAKKLQLEIKELERPFFKKASFLSLIVPLFAALVTGLIGYLGNLEIQKLRDQRKHLEETTRQLTIDQQQFISSSISSIQDYLTYLSLLEKYKDNPDALFTKSAIKDAAGKMDAFLMSQGKSALLCRSFADRYQDLLGEEKATEIKARCDSVSALVEKMRTQINKQVSEVLRELRR